MDGGNEERREETVGLVVIVVFAVLAVCSLLVACCYYCYIRFKLSQHLKTKSLNAADEESADAVAAAADERENETKRPHTATAMGAPTGEKVGVVVFPFKQLHIATGGFGKGNAIGHGSFGSVYKGVLGDGRKIAVKLMDHAGKQGEEEFKMEVDLLTRLRSPYLLQLIGYCSDSDNRILVYEFMANGGLQDLLYPTAGGASKLEWEMRMRIALEAAKGLEYLHEHVTPPVIHRDFKSSNILLDRNLHAKVSDFGLAKLGSDKIGGHVSTRVLGTQGYVAPEYALTGHLTTKSDVYSYGVVLLELITGRVPVDVKRPAGEGLLVSWVSFILYTSEFRSSSSIDSDHILLLLLPPPIKALPHLAEREKIVHIIDPSMEQGKYKLKDVVQVAAIAAMCVQPEADYRPLMADVVQSLVPLVMHKPRSSI